MRHRRSLTKILREIPLINVSRAQRMLADKTPVLEMRDSGSGLPPAPSHANGLNGPAKPDPNPNDRQSTSALPTHIRPSNSRPSASQNPHPNATGQFGIRDTESGFRPTVTRGDLLHLDFYKQTGWVDEAAEVLFKIRSRNTTIRAECYFGLIHFISCVFVLAVIPQQLMQAGYDGRATVVSTAATCGVGCIICGLFANLPFVLAPPAVIGIFLTNNIQTNNLSPSIGSSAVLVSGVVLTLLGYRPLAQFVSMLIPLPIQV